MARKKTKNPEKSYQIFWWIVALLVVLFIVAGVFFFSSGDYLIFENILWVFRYLWWLILPFPAWLIFMTVWMEYAEFSFASKGKFILLEIRPPRETEKSPKIMEQVFAGMHSWSAPNKFEKYCGWRPLQDKYTFEIVSIEGTVRFFVRCPVAAKNNVEAQIYAHYPDAEIFEAEDYTLKVPRNLPNKDWDVWGTSLTLLKDDVVPIRVYKYFQEDVTGNMIDPLASMTEAMSQIGKNEHMWFQIIFTPAYEPDWVPAAKQKLEEIKEEFAGNKKVAKMGRVEKFFLGFGRLISNIFRGIVGSELNLSPLDKGEDKKNEFNVQRLRPAQQDLLKAIEENIAKPGFWTSMRYVYIGKKDGSFNKALGVAGFMGAIKQLADNNLNSLVPNNATKTFANYYFSEPRLQYRQRKIVGDYKDRAFQGTQFLFNIEELATVFHFPDVSVKTPAIQRIEAKKGDAPFNLPVVE